MKILVNGTAAAEAWPAPWCRCQHCENARRLGGKNLRGRSGYLLESDLKIDYGPDTTSQIMASGRSLADVRTIVFTHHHSDHISPGELAWMVPPYSQTPPTETVSVYGNDIVIGLLQERLPEAVLNLLELHTLQALQTVTLNSGDELLPLPADHAPGSFMLRLSRRGRHILIGHDSGLYPQESLDALAAGPPLDLAFLDCTCGGLVQYNQGHMSIAGVVQMTQELRARGAFTPNTRVFANHFSHNGGMLHEELVEYFKPHNIEVAFDGMEVETAGESR